jgi:hypothetical protein
VFAIEILARLRYAVSRLTPEPSPGTGLASRS